MYATLHQQLTKTPLSLIKSHLSPCFGFVMPMLEDTVGCWKMLDDTNDKIRFVLSYREKLL